MTSFSPAGASAHAIVAAPAIKLNTNSRIDV
jgi:hypothetical protein